MLGATGLAAHRPHEQQILHFLCSTLALGADLAEGVEERVRKVQLPGSSTILPLQNSWVPGTPICMDPYAQVWKQPGVSRDTSGTITNKNWSLGQF
jgi:hypothetical protein